MLDWGLSGQKMPHLVFTQPSICQGCEPHMILASVLMQINMAEYRNPTDGNAVRTLMTMGGSSQESMCVNELQKQGKVGDEQHRDSSNYRMTTNT